MKIIFFLFSILCIQSFAILPEKNIPLLEYEKAGKKKRFGAVGKISFFVKEVIKDEQITVTPGMCTGTLVKISDGLGVVLTAGHCVDFFATDKVTKCRQKDNFNPLFFDLGWKLEAENQEASEDFQRLPIIGHHVEHEYLDKRNEADLQFDFAMYFVDMRAIKKGSNVSEVCPYFSGLFSR
jgi:hypothetical protein